MSRTVVLDSTLSAELGSPGADTRFGVTIVAYPPPDLRQHIADLSTRLKAVEPGQYYYPPTDLHVTVLEVISDVTQGEANTVRDAILRRGPHFWKALPGARLASPSVRSDETACALTFAEQHGLETLRNELSRRLTVAGLKVAPRYRSPSAHVTFLRYVAEPRATQDDWNRAIAALPGLRSADAAGRWSLDALWLTCGATWYGRSGRVRKDGPYATEPAG
jgi:2'-5' RNA ligase